MHIMEGIRFIDNLLDRISFLNEVNVLDCVVHPNKLPHNNIIP